MASLIPPLSDKAKLEIAHIQTDRYNPLGSFEGFQDLFDLEKYPITFDQMKAYLSMLPKVELRCCYQHGLEYRLDHTRPDGECYARRYKKQYGDTYRVSIPNLIAFNDADSLEARANTAIETIIIVENVSRADLFFELNILDPVGSFVYEKRFVDKILIEEKQVTLRRTAYPCGVYELARLSGFEGETEEDMLKEFIGYHREKYAHRKYIHYFKLIKDVIIT